MAIQFGTAEARRLNWASDIAFQKLPKLDQSILKCSNLLGNIAKSIDLFTDMAAILNCIVSNSYYGMLTGQIGAYLPPEYQVIDI